MNKRARLLGLLLAFAVPLVFTTSATAATPICTSLANYLGSNTTPWNDSIGNVVYWALYNWHEANC